MNYLILNRKNLSNSHFAYIYLSRNYHIFSSDFHAILLPQKPEGIDMERYVVNGYVKMIAISIDDFESKIIDEKNTNFIQDIETFQKKYSNKNHIKCMFLHMIGNDYIQFDDYKKIMPHIHPFDYMRDLIKSHSGHLLEESAEYTVKLSADEMREQKSISDVIMFPDPEK